jgi:predicted NBD/HSP70 family sugar kinase
LVGVPLDELVARALGNGLGEIWPVSDAVAAAYDIWLTRNLKGRLLVLALGTGIGAAVLDDGVPLKVDGDSPGHLGQMDVSIEGAPVIGPDGGAGSLEGYLGLPALRKKYGEQIAATLKKLSGDEPELLALARAIRIAHAIYCPHHVVLAGGIGTRLEHVMTKLRERVDKDLTRIARPGWSLSVAEHDFHSAAGAAKMARTG